MNATAVISGLMMTAFVVVAPLHAATWYVSNAGSDQNAGRTEAAPFATLSYARTKLAARDTLLLRRGDLFRDTLNCSSTADPVIGAYGQPSLPRPIVSGSIAITGWTRFEGSIWVANCDKKIEHLYADNRLMPLARYPDTGWLRIDSVIENSDGTNTTVRINALARHPRNAAGYWNGAQVRWRRWSWWYETRPVTAYAQTGTLSLGGKSENHIMGDSGCKGWHLYIDKKREELDAPGEWFYDSTAKKVYFYPPAGVDPSTLTVEGTVATTGITLAGGTVDNICLRHFRLYGLSLSKKSIVTRCRFQGIGGESGGAALRASWDIADSRIEDNVFEDNLNIGISWYENSGRKGKTIIQRDTLLNTGVVPGYGGSGSWHAVGILVHLSSNVQVQYNYLDKTGYAAVLLGSDSNFVQYNIIKRAMWTLNDGGAIYTDCSKSFIRNNIIYDTRGDLSSSGPWYPLGHGIWLEFLGDYRESVVENNTIVRSGAYGIYLPNNFACTISGNVLYDNAETQLCLGGQETNTGISPPRTQNLPQNHRITGNICCALARRQKTLTFQSQYHYGTLQGNWFLNPYTDSVISGYGTGSNRYRLYNYTIPQWQSQFSAWADASAKTDPFKRPTGMPESKPYGRAALFINESAEALSIPLGATVYRDLDNKPVSGSVTVPPFYSKVLVYADSTLGIASGLDATGRELPGVSSDGCRYWIPAAGTVTIALYNQAGRRIALIKSRHDRGGSYRLWERPLAPGGVAWHCTHTTSAGTATTKGTAFVIR